MEKAREAIVEKQAKLRKLEDLLKAYRAGKELKGHLKTFAAEKSAPKNDVACKAAIAKLRDRIQKDEQKM